MAKAAKATLCRVIVWTKDCSTLAEWYRTTFGWPITVDHRADGWIELDAGGIALALHGGRPDKKARAWPKLQLLVDDLVGYRASLIERGIKMGKLNEWRDQAWSQGSDPEGNTFQISSR